MTVNYFIVKRLPGNVILMPLEPAINHHAQKTLHLPLCDKIFTHLLLILSVINPDTELPSKLSLPK